MKRAVSSVLLMAVLLLTFACGMSQASQESEALSKLYGAGKVVRAGDINIIPGIVYDARKRLSYDLYVPTTEKIKSGSAIVFIHGGAWVSGGRGDMSGLCLEYAKLGYITATLDYTLFSPERRVTFSVMLDEIGQCLANLRDSTQKAGCPIGKIALSGYSAGGHLALLYAFSRRELSPLPIGFVFSAVGPSYFGADAWPKNSPFGMQIAAYRSGDELALDPSIRLVLDSISNNARGFKKNSNPEELDKELAKVSPAMLVTSKTLPCVLAYGMRDDLVPPPHSKKLTAALKAKGVNHVCVNFPNSGHGLDKDPEAAKRYKKAVLEFCQKYL